MFQTALCPGRRPLGGHAGEAAGRGSFSTGRQYLPDVNVKCVLHHWKRGTDGAQVWRGVGESGHDPMPLSLS